MSKLFVAFFLFLGIASGAQTKIKFPYQGGLSELEKDLSQLYVEAEDSGRIYFAEFGYVKETGGVILRIHGSVEKDVTRELIRLFFQRNLDKWNIKALKKSSVIIPLFIEGYSVDKSSNTNLTNLWLQAANISNSFQSKSCILTKPFLITKSEIHIELEN